MWEDRGEGVRRRVVGREKGKGERRGGEEVREQGRGETTREGRRGNEGGQGETTGGRREPVGGWPWTSEIMTVKVT
jgi:hypothetical protein